MNKKIPKKKNKILNSNGKPLSISEKASLFIFMRATPLLVDMWKKSDTSLTFDAWLLSVYEENKNLK